MARARWRNGFYAIEGFFRRSAFAFINRFRAGNITWDFVGLNRERLRPEYRPYFEAGIARILDESGISAGCSILELGSGGGIFCELSPRWIKQNWTQLDNDSRALAYAKRKNFGSRWQVVASVYALPFAHGSYKAIVSLESLNTFENVEQIIREANRVLTMGGQFIHIGDYRYMLADDHELFTVAQQFRDVSHVGAKLKEAYRKSSGVKKEKTAMLMEVYRQAKEMESINLDKFFVIQLKHILERNRFQVERIGSQRIPQRREGDLEYLIATKISNLPSFSARQPRAMVRKT